MSDNHPISFGDHVGVLSNPITEKMGLAGLIGQVHGETTPSVTGVEVIGDVKEGYAVNVFFEEREEGYWFAPELLKFVDHGAGTEVTLKGVSKKWTRNSTGSGLRAKAKKKAEIANDGGRFGKEV